MVGFNWSETVTMELSNRIKRSGDVNNLECILYNDKFILDDWRYVLTAADGYRWYRNNFFE